MKHAHRTATHAIGSSIHKIDLIVKVGRELNFILLLKYLPFLTYVTNENYGVLSFRVRHSHSLVKELVVIPTVMVVVNIAVMVEGEVMVMD